MWASWERMWLIRAADDCWTRRSHSFSHLWQILIIKLLRYLWEAHFRHLNGKMTWNWEKNLEFWVEVKWLKAVTCNHSVSYKAWFLVLVLWWVTGKERDQATASKSSSVSFIRSAASSSFLFFFLGHSKGCTWWIPAQDQTGNAKTRLLIIWQKPAEPTATVNCHVFYSEAAPTTLHSSDSS